MNEEELLEKTQDENQETPVKRARRKKGDADGRINTEKFSTSIARIEKESLIKSDQIIALLKQAIRRAYLTYIYPGLYSKDNNDSGKEFIEAEVEFEKNFKEIKIYDVKLITEDKEEDVVDPAYQISLEEVDELLKQGVIKSRKQLKKGDKVRIPCDFSSLPSKVARNSQIYFTNYLNDASRQAVFEVYHSQIDGLIEGEVTKIDRYDDSEGGIKGIEVSFGKASGYLKRNALLPQDRFAIKDKVLVYLCAISEKSNPTSLIISRSDERFVVKLMEKNIPELEEGIVKIEGIARECGKRTKIFVSSTNPNIDPVGTCLGPESSRIRSVLAELKGEKIDIMPYYENKALQIIEALKPASVSGLTCDDDFFDENVHYRELESEKDYEFPKITAIVMNGHLGVAIGMKGVNVKLASKLTKCSLSVLETDVAIQKGILYKSISEIYSIIESMHPELAKKKVVEEIIDDDDLPEETYIEQKEREQKEELENSMSENENAESVPEEKEEKIEIKNIPEPEHSFSALEEALDSKGKKNTTVTKKKNFKKKKVEEVKEENSQIQGLPIYTDEELENLENSIDEIDDTDEYEDDYSEYDSDEFYQE